MHQHRATKKSHRCLRPLPRRSSVWARPSSPISCFAVTELGQYTYDSAGRITSLTQQLYKPSNTTATSTAVTATTALYTIGYDSLGRVASFSRAAGTGAASTAPLSAQSAVFTYDANGNRLSSIQTTGSGASAQNTHRTYTVDPASNRVLGFSQTLSTGTPTGTTTGGTTANVAYQYDANGSLLKDGLRSYEFDAANRLANATTGVGTDAPTTRYVHNALGQRLFKTEPLFAPVASGSNPSDPGVMAALISFFTSLWGGNTTLAAPSTAEKLGYQYFYDEEGSLLYELGAGGANSVGSAHYVYLPTPAGPLPIAAYTGNRHYAVHTDHLNTPRRLTQSNKQVAWQWAFSAFGDEQPTTGKNRYVDPTTTPNAGSTTIADVTFNLRYPGQYFDKESGLSYNYFRSYDAKTGRYTQSDPIGLDGGWDKFGYADGDGINNFDRWGLETCLLTTVGPGGIRDHAAIFTSRGDGKGGPAMYDPAGAYSPANLGGSGDIVTGSAANMQKFRDFHKPQTVETSCKNTSRAEEESIINKASDLPSAAPFQCSIRSSTALSGHPSFPNVKPETFWPGNLRRQFK